MIIVEKLFNSLKKNNIDFFTGVPDSVLKNFSIYLQNLNLNIYSHLTYTGYYVM